LLSDAYPNAAQTNLNTITSLAQEQTEDGTSYLLAKVSGKLPHTGGSIYPDGTDQYTQLQSFVRQVTNPDTSAPDCESSVAGVDPRLSKVLTLDARATFRKAAINIAGRVPTSDEDSRLAQSPDQLSASINSLLEENAFYERLKEIFNDAFLFIARGQEGQPGVGRFGYFYFQETDYPNIWVNLTSTATDDPERIVFLDHEGVSLWEEPLALLAHIARNNRPFTEILTANYTVVNPYSAYLYGLGPVPGTDSRMDDWAPAPAPLVQRQGSATEAAVESSGVLSTPAFLTRWGSTSTNLSRGRAEFVSKNFLATSILTFAQRPVNSTQLDAVDNPTINNLTCAACHRYMDPLAGTFLGFSNGAPASYIPQNTAWSGSQYTPAGFLGEPYPGDRTHAMPWMAQKIAADQRFPYAMVLRVFEGVTGRKPLAYPTNTDSNSLSAWESQNAFLHEVAAHMAEQGMNIKVAFREILLSPYFRAAQDPNLPAALAIGLGEGRLLTPEILARKVRATLGTHWGRFRSNAPYDFLTSDYNILYGGINPTESPARMTEINTMMAAVAGAMAREMGCRIPAWEFTKSPDARVVLPKVQIDTAPLRKNCPTCALEVDDAGERSIRENLAYLHQRLLGEVVDPNSPEVDTSYALFVDAWKEREEANTTSAYWNCTGQWDLNTPANNDIYISGYATLPEDQRITTDRYFTIYAWEAVLTYMLMDYRFIHE